MNVLMTEQVNKEEITLLIRSSLMSGFLMMDMQFFSIEE